jgi:hypothetical protein
MFSRRIVRRAFAVLAGAVVGMCLCTSARADDIAASFSATSNPNGPWSYGTFTESTSTFTLFTVSGTSCGGGIPFWSAPGGFPIVEVNNTGSTQSCGTVTVPTDTLDLHPQDLAGTDADVRWTAPASGTYQISGSYSALDSTTTFDSILVNGASVFSTNIDSSNKSANFALTKTLVAGSTIDFTVNCCSGLDQDYFFDSTGLQGTINLNSTATPEPSTLLLALSTSALLLPLIRHRLS